MVRIPAPQEDGPAAFPVQRRITSSTHRNDGWFHEQFKISFTRPGLSDDDKVLELGPDLVLESVRIRWGRDSLFQAPMRRTLTFTAWMGTDRLELWNWRVLRVVCRVGTREYFTGQIDTIRRVGPDLIEFSATESPRWADRVRGFPSFDATDVDGAREEARSRGFRLANLPIAVYPRPSYGPQVITDGKSQYQITFDQLLRIAVAPYPGSFVQYLPSGLVGCTMAANDAATVRELHSDAVIIDDNWAIRYDDTPFRVAMQSDNAWIQGPKRITSYFHDEAVRSQHVKVNSFMSWGNFQRLDNGITFGIYNESGDRVADDPRPRVNSYYRFADVIRGQTTSPRKITFLDTLIEETTSARAYFYTWEEHANFQVVEDVPDRGPWRIIGGTLTIAHGKTTHETTAVWARSHPTYGYPNASDVSINSNNTGRADMFIGMA